MMLHRPFTGRLEEVNPKELASLREKHEGWFVEYKRRMIGLSEIAKSLSSFANQYGGCLFIGVEEGGEQNVADNFPGIPSNEVQRTLESIRNATADYLQPSVFYIPRVFEGPVEDIGLKSGKSIIAIEVPRGPDTPYIHKDGVIYLRVGDSSRPTAVTDRTTFNLLVQRGLESRSRLAERVLWQPVTSQAEEKQRSCM